MSSPYLPDLRFDKPSKECLLDLIQRQRYLQFDPAHVEIVSITPSDAQALSTEHVLLRTVFDTTAELEISLPNKPAEVIKVQYFRMLLPAFLYKELIRPQKTLEAFLLMDRFETTIATAAADALAYLKSEYHVELSLDECEVHSHHTTPYLDGSWDVVVAPNPTHPIWVGPVLLTAYNGVT